MKYKALLLAAVCIFFTYGFAVGQNNLDRNIALNLKSKKIAEVLTTIGRQNNFYFSYSNNWVPVDSVIDLSCYQTIREVLDGIFKGKVDYKETPGYIILKRAPYRLAVFPDNSTEPDQTFVITGHVVDEKTGMRLAGASVFEKHILLSTLTDQNGYFRLKIKYKGPLTLTVSKELYKDIDVNLLNDVTVYPTAKNYYYSADTSYKKVEKSLLGRWFISSRQKMQSLNIGNFISTVPVQTSLTPGLSSHGMMTSQVINKVSLNMLGGYTAGVNGIEVAGLFNINKLDVRFMQLAGLFNVNGGNLAGIQAAGLTNVVYKDTKGIQVAGLINLVKGTSAGLQVAGLYNKARVMKGFHVGVLNVADTLEGFAFNVLSISRNGYHQIALYSDETANTSISYKTGNKQLYTRLLAGFSYLDELNFYSLGFALGHDFTISKRLKLSADASTQQLYTLKWKNDGNLYKFSTLLNVALTNKTGLFFGPSLKFYQEDAMNSNAAQRLDINKNLVGWTAGITVM
ncbi:carboxypeptidase-like regulatory domain-containing protein [Pedobacter sp. MR2016-24]|uniref:carboxypeptidase-like regulatory domain-containing protein n=1 Tax=Pedobacter sp. MR2016-24 TaxID=2994466 RepID=UPI002245F0F9|nr:carboxypeptidase-like regulatory domain-containing protein [Pedobacter sp. MR2016-24]MCX2484944.1 carboxypeptidase-like regulatory domain-containing protein [Pedobacter sp. MR2016-24]